MKKVIRTIVVTTGTLRLPREISRAIKGCHCVCVSQRPVMRCWQKKIHAALKPHVARLDWVAIPNGEQAKTLQVVEKLYHQLNRLGATRDTVLIAVGGGVVGDTCGFVAASYLRGLQWLAFPTTLLSQVDSSIGGKVGVDLAGAKNAVGAFYHPQAVWAHIPWLDTLSARAFRQGIAELVKYGLTNDRAILTRLQTPGKLLAHPTLFWLVCRAVLAKTRVVAQDERDDRGIRAVLNFGHTVGHAVESLGRFSQYWHGEAVSIGLVAVLRLGVTLGFTPNAMVTQVVPVLKKWGLPTDLPRFSKSQWRKALQMDKKRQGRSIRLIVLQQWKKTIGVPMTPEKLAAHLCTQSSSTIRRS